MARHHADDLDERDERGLLLLILAELADIEDTLAALLASSHSPGTPVRGTIVFEGVTMADVTVPDSQATSNVTVTYVDAEGDATNPQSPPVWSSSDESVATVDSSADPSGMTAVVTYTHALGSTVISAATTNSDGTVVTASGTATVAAGAPADGTVTFS